jgi:N6-adenosine-specific RNA methylase IME4
MSEERLAFHEYADIFPMLPLEELDTLAADIAANGLLEPITLYEGKVLDGRNRYVACLNVAVDPRLTQYTGDDPLGFVVSKNLHRRQLTSSQRAVVALEVERHIALRGRDNQSTQTTQGYQRIDNPVDALRDAADLVGTNRQYVSDAKKIAAQAPELIPQIASGAMTIPEAKRELKEQEREAKREANRELVESTAPIAAAPNVRYPVIVLDPPWDWGDEGDVDQFGRARPTYDTMPFSDILALPVADLAEKNAHIYLWITNRSLPKGFQLLEAWGFRYITALTWCKPHFGMGNYFRGSTEHVLFGVRGSLPLLRKDTGTWFSAPRPGRHSAKPDEFYTLVESCSPGPWLEMFARERRAGWAAWGAEV